MRIDRLLLAISSVVLGACATRPHQATISSAPHPAAHAASTGQDSLTQAQITAADLPTAYDLVDRLRHRWLMRDASTGGSVVVYVDDQDIGGASALREIPAGNVASMRYLPNDQAIKRWGEDIKGGVIVVTKRY